MASVMDFACEQNTTLRFCSFPASNMMSRKMSATTKLNFEQFLSLPERKGTIYELDEGELLMEPSPSARHNLIRQRIALRLMQLTEATRLGMVLEEMDFRLTSDTVRNPDVAFLAQEHVACIDLDRSPIDGAPPLLSKSFRPATPPKTLPRRRSNIFALEAPGSGSSIPSFDLLRSTRRLECGRFVNPRT
jgi:Putative restriction endonuclease